MLHLNLLQFFNRTSYVSPVFVDFDLNAIQIVFNLPQYFLI